MFQRVTEAYKINTSKFKIATYDTSVKSAGLDRHHYSAIHTRFFLYDRSNIINV
jgi:hypothetical protein